MNAVEEGIDVRYVIQDVLALEGKIRGQEFETTCINPTHQDSKPSFGVCLQTGFASCFSCGWSGDLAGVVAVALNIPYHEAIRRISPGSPQSLAQVIRHRLLIKPPKNNSPLPGPYLRGPLDYLRKRGFTDDTLLRYDIRWCPHQKIIGQSSVFHVMATVAIPLLDTNGKKIAWIYRKTNKSPEWQPRYIYTPGAPVGSVWFGSDLVRDDHTVVVAEGPLDAMWIDQAGYAAVGCMGSNPSLKKITWLKQFDRVLIFPDRDRAGLKLAHRIIEGLHHAVPVGIVRYPRNSDAKDPCELNDIQIAQAIEKAQHELTWSVLRKRA